MLLGVGKSTFEKSYKELTGRTLKLAAVTDGLGDYLINNGFQVFCSNVNTMQAVMDVQRASDTINNGCTINFITRAYRLKHSGE